MLIYLDLTKRVDLVFWGILVVGFFTFFRKSNLIPDTAYKFNPVRHLSRQAVQVEKDVVIVTATWAKNNQYGQKKNEVPLFRIPNSPLCPVTTVTALKKLSGKKSASLFSLAGNMPFTYPRFQVKLKETLGKAGYDSEKFSSHSMRRGGTMWAFRSGVPESLIKVQGDWSSDAYKTYLSFPVEVRAVVNLKMRESIQSKVIHF